MEWFDKTFDELSAREIFAILKLRCEVFNGEQECITPDPDDQDLACRHIFCTDDGNLVAYARYFTEDGNITFGRVVIAKDHRGTGISQTLMENIMAGIKNYFPGNKILIHAQYYVRGYYAKYGFTEVGEPFMEAERKHIAMEHPAL
ncbi:MAG: GNAT family N-acetyltransferase [Limosilactobacillus sp.]|uniref:GNAT family N-acetyltransferase n=1 Tax=Limosilactobacillus sp. TaxID=2773925 RepID=UPI00270310A5|nr:GNAT family N-acetyltransferase [Limosilactobacillus sp.]